MQYDVNNGLLQVVIEGEELNAVVGEAAQINVGEAINYIQSGKAEIEEAVEEGISDFNENATEKTNEFDLNAQNKTSDFNSNATQKTLDFNSNASDKTSEFNLNAQDKTSYFNTNAVEKTNDFNSNAQDKTEDFNDNATDKTGDFNDNASDKTSDFNLNAQNKTSDFNDNYTEKKGLIDAQVVIAEGAATTATNQAGLAKQWAIGDPSEPTGNSAKYWATQSSNSATSAATSEDHAEIWAEGTDEQVQALGGVHSSKGWAAESATGQINSNWTENDPTSKAYILNKPTAGANISLANNQIAAVSDASPTQNSTNLVQSGGVYSGLDNLQSQLNAKADDSDVVKLTVNQIITSTKQINDNSLYFKDTTHTRAGETTAAWQTNQILFLDKNGSRVSRIQPFYEANGIQRITIAVDDGTEKSFNFFSNGALTLGANPGATNSKTDLWAATRGWVNDPSLSTNVVHRDGNETIAGQKTFNSAYTLFKGTDIDITNAKTTQNDVAINWIDKNGTVLGQNHIRTYTNGCVQNNMYIKAHNSNNWQNIGIGYDANDNVYTYAPTPATSDNSSQIATTAFVNNKLNTTPHIVETYVNGTEWYRIYSDGWIEQGGYVTSSGSQGKTVNMLKSFSNTNYTIVGSCGGNGTEGYSPTFLNKTNSTFLWRTFNSGQGYDKNGSWYACGY